MECQLDKGKNHSLKGGRDEFKEMAGEHMACYKHCADSLIHSMSAIITAKPMKWTCKFCRDQLNPKELNTETDMV